MKTFKMNKKFSLKNVIISIMLFLSIVFSFGLLSSSINNNNNISYINYETNQTQQKDTKDGDGDGETSVLPENWVYIHEDTFKVKQTPGNNNSLTLEFEVVIESEIWFDPANKGPLFNTEDLWVVMGTSVGPEVFKANFIRTLPATTVPPAYSQFGEPTIEKYIFSITEGIQHHESYSGIELVCYEGNLVDDLLTDESLSTLTYGQMINNDFHFKTPRPKSLTTWIVISSLLIAFLIILIIISIIFKLSKKIRLRPILVEENSAIIVINRNYYKFHGELLNNDLINGKTIEPLKFIILSKDDHAQEYDYFFYDKKIGNNLFVKLIYLEPNTKYKKIYIGDIFDIRGEGKKAWQRVNGKFKTKKSNERLRIDMKPPENK